MKIIGNFICKNPDIKFPIMFLFNYFQKMYMKQLPEDINLNSNLSALQ